VKENRKIDSKIKEGVLDIDGVALYVRNLLAENIVARKVRHKGVGVISRVSE
jgi:hypothetical protein